MKRRSWNKGEIRPMTSKKNTLETKKQPFDFDSSIPTTSKSEINTALDVLVKHKDAWVATGVHERITVLDRIIKDFAPISDDWVSAGLAARGIDPDSRAAGDEWIGLSIVWRQLRTMRQSLCEIEAKGRPIIPGPINTRPDGQVVARVMPRTKSDRNMYRGITADVWMEQGTAPEEVVGTQAQIYRDKSHPGKVALVLGAGNHAFLCTGDLLHKLFVEDQVVIFKLNPVNQYLGSLMEKGFRTLVEKGFLRFIYGGVVEGGYLVDHPAVDDLHMTGSDKTYDAIVFDTGPEGAKRKKERRPLVTKRFTAELGCVSPVIVVPGAWSRTDIGHQAASLGGMLTHNAGFNCITTRVIITHSNWAQRTDLLGALREELNRVPTLNAYYPGAHQRHAKFVAAHPEAEQFGEATAEKLPWTLIQGLDPKKKDDICFKTEAFCSLFAETPIDAASVVEYIERAVEFANDTLWGTLSATIVVHPDSLLAPAIAEAVEQAVANLRYGTVGVNVWGALNYAFGVTTWGAFPGHDSYDIQSGSGVVGNMLMFARPQKSVVRGPFRQQLRSAALLNKFNILGRRIAFYEAKPSVWNLASLIIAASRVR